MIKFLKGKGIILLFLGIPTYFWSGTCGDYNVMIIDLLGPSMEDLLNYCNRSFSLVTTIIIAEQMIERIEYIHSKNFLHRDIKPDNFVIGREGCSLSYI